MDVNVILLCTPVNLDILIPRSDMWVNVFQQIKCAIKCTCNFYERLRGFTF